MTVGVVALPLALAFGITSGLGAQAGVTTAIIAGFVAGVFGGSNVQVSGPTGAMTVVLVPIVARHGIDAVFVVGIMAGVLLIAASFLGVGRFMAFIPWSVIEGFTVGIAVIIFLQQVPGALGVARPEGENVAAVAVRAASGALAGEGNATAAILVALVVAVMFIAPRIHPAIPASLAAVVAATVAAALAGWDLAVIGALPNSLPLPSLPTASPDVLRALIPAGMAVAVLSGLESLLSAKVADGMAGVGRHDPDRELFGQGLANIATPFFGGMPATGAIARTAVNVRSGGRSRLSAIVHAVALIGVILVAARLVGRIPLAALAGVLMVTAVRMVEVSNVRSILRSTRSDAVVLILTATVTVAFDLILAIEVGMAVAAGLALRQVARTATVVAAPLPLVDPEVADGLRRDHIVSYRLDGALFFGAVQQFLAAIVVDSDIRVVILRLPELQVLDATGAQALGEVITELEGRGVTVLLKGPRPEHLRVLSAVGAIDRLAHDRHLFEDLDAAVAHAREHARVGSDERSVGADRPVPSVSERTRAAPRSAR